MGSDKQPLGPIFRMTVALVCRHGLIIKGIPPVVTGKWTGSAIGKG
jgi:hypothetical protein